MIIIEQFIRNSGCLVVFRDDTQQLSIGSIQLSEQDAPLINHLEEAVNAYNRSKQEPEARTITGAPNPPR